MVTQLEQRLLAAEEFLRIDFGSDIKAELDNGVIRMMAGAARGHDRVQTNIIVALANVLRGSGCRPSGSDMAVRTHSGSIRYPDVSVTCGRNTTDDDRLKAVLDPAVIFEILSPGTAADDRGVKLDEYKALASIETIVHVDPERETVRVVQRTGRNPEAWSDVDYTMPQDVALPTLDVVISHADIFARD